MIRPEFFQSKETRQSYKSGCTIFHSQTQQRGCCWHMAECAADKLRNRSGTRLPSTQSTHASSGIRITMDVRVFLETVLEQSENTHTPSSASIRRIANISLQLSCFHAGEKPKNVIKTKIRSWVMDNGWMDWLTQPVLKHVSMSLKLTFTSGLRPKATANCYHLAIPVGPSWDTCPCLYVCPRPRKLWSAA